jgi:hypothetical protein
MHAVFLQSQLLVLPTLLNENTFGSVNFSHIPPVALFSPSPPDIALEFDDCGLGVGNWVSVFGVSIFSLRVVSLSPPPESGR